jgi:hypothetical protein
LEIFLQPLFLFLVFYFSGDSGGQSRKSGVQGIMAQASLHKHLCKSGSEVSLPAGRLPFVLTASVMTASHV